MGAAGIELPDFLNLHGGAQRIERVYSRSLALQNMGERNHYARRMLEGGLRRARARDPHLLKFLDLSSEYFRKRNDEQKSRFKQMEGRDGKIIEHERPNEFEFSEYATWREAFLRVDAPQHREDQLRIFGWIYACVHEYLGA